MKWILQMTIRKRERGMFKLPSIDKRFTTAELIIQFGLDPTLPIADGYGHHEDCQWFVQEVEKTDVDWAVEQLRSTIEQLRDKNLPVDKAFVIIQRAFKSAKYESKRGILYYKGSKKPCTVRGITIRVVHDKEIRRENEWRFFYG